MSINGLLICLGIKAEKKTNKQTTNNSDIGHLG